jgi:histidinol phosphatase-like PHP family hydrolase
MAAGNYIDFGREASAAKASGVDFAIGTTTNIVNEAADNYDKFKQIGKRYGMTDEVINNKMMSLKAWGRCKCRNCGSGG